jgi:Flp pilus assembly protein TadG
MPPRRPAAVAIEMALVLPFLAAACAMALDFARVLQAAQVLQSAAAAGAACATGTTWTTAPPGGEGDAAREAACAEAATLAPPLRPDQVTVTADGPLVTVAVDYDFPLLTAAVVPEGTVRLRRSVTARITPQAGN